MTLPDRQVVYLSTQTQSAVVNVWYHHVSILIGLGTDPTVERKILNSISYNSAATNTTVLGRCPTADQTPPVMPTPIRLTAPLAVPDDSGGRMQPASSRVQPKIGAVAVWRRFFQSTGGMPVIGALNWAIYLGNYSDFNNASAPTWLIVGHGVHSDYGPCGVTVFAPYNAATGHPLGMETIG